MIEKEVKEREKREGKNPNSCVKNPNQLHLPSRPKSQQNYFNSLIKSSILLLFLILLVSFVSSGNISEFERACFSPNLVAISRNYSIANERNYLPLLCII